jgi:PAS domain-containing protein
MMRKERNLSSRAAFLLSRGCQSTPSQRLAPAKIFSLQRLHLFSNCSRQEDKLIDWLASKYEGAHLDGIVAASEICLRIAIGLRARIAPETPIVFVGITSNRITPYLTQPRVTGVIHDFPVGDLVATAMRFFPNTRHLAHLGHADGTLNIGPGVPQALADQARQRGLSMISLCDLSLAEFKLRIASLPPDTVIVYDSYWRGPTGTHYVPSDFLEAVSRDSATPFFGLVDTHVGCGLIGGLCMDLHRMGAEAAGLALQSMGSTTTPAVVHHRAQPMFDARLLDRFRIDRQALPVDSKIFFEEPDLFQKHRGALIGAGTALLVQALLITALVLQLRYRRQAERRLRESEDQLLRQVADAPIPIVYTTQNSDALAINNMFARLFGWTSQDLPTQ